MSYLVDRPSWVPTRTVLSAHDPLLGNIFRAGEPVDFWVGVLAGVLVMGRTVGWVVVGWGWWAGVGPCWSGGEVGECSAGDAEGAQPDEVGHGCGEAELGSGGGLAAAGELA